MLGKRLKYFKNKYGFVNSLYVRAWPDMGEIISQDYKAFLVALKNRIRSGQYEALKSVNKELISMHWDIGQMIVERRGKLG